MTREISLIFKRYLATREKEKLRKNTVVTRMNIQLDEMTKYGKSDIMLKMRN